MKKKPSIKLGSFCCPHCKLHYGSEQHLHLHLDRDHPNLGLNSYNYSGENPKAILLLKTIKDLLSILEKEIK